MIYLFWCKISEDRNLFWPIFLVHNYMNVRDLQQGWFKKEWAMNKKWDQPKDLPSVWWFVTLGATQTIVKLECLAHYNINKSPVTDVDEPVHSIQVTSTSTHCNPNKPIPFLTTRYSKSETKVRINWHWGHLSLPKIRTVCWIV